MNTNTHIPSITHLDLFRKYQGNIKRAHEQELRAASRSIPRGTNALSALFLAARQYEEELDRQYQCQGAIPAVCVDKEGTCDEDHCRCWK